MPRPTILRTGRTVVGAQATVVCLPYAGGGPAAFRDWQQRTRRLEVVTVHLPGRESRLGEPPFTSIESAVETLCEAVASFDHDFVLFGHSMGAMMAFELARRLDEVDDARLQKLFIAGCPPPQAPALPPVHDLPAPALIEYIATLGGLPAEALDFPELLELMLPTLRADFTIVDNYRYVEGPPLSYPLHVFYGDADPHCGHSEANDWGRHTRSTFRTSKHRGDHFFPFDDPDPIVAIMEQAILPAWRVSS